MANTVRIKRRGSGGAAGAPSSLENAELAFNEVDDTLYIGKGTGGAGGTATSIVAIGGPGSFVTKDSPALTGTPTAPTPASGDNTTKIATTAFVKNQSYISGNQAITVSGDASGSGTTAIALTLANTGVTAGTFGSASAVPVVTVDAKGRVTSVSTSNISGSLSFTGDVSGTGSTGATTTLTLSTSGATAGTYGSATAAPVVTVDAKGRVTGVSSATVTPAWGSISSKPTTLSGFGITDAYDKTEVDSLLQGLDPKQSVRAATTANITLSGAQTIDGIAVVAGDRVLVKNQSTASQNGIYVAASGAWSRSADADVWTELPGAYAFVEQGTINAEMGFVCTVDQGGTIGTTAVTFQQFSGAGQVIAGNGLTKTGNQLDIGTASSARIVVNTTNIDLATIGTAGTYKITTVDAYGRVTSGSNPTTLSGFGITDAQPLNTELTAIGALTSAADRLPYFTGSGTAALTVFTAFGRSLVDDTTAAAARTTLGLGTIATQASTSVAITGGSVTNLATFDGITIDGGTF